MLVDAAFDDDVVVEAVVVCNDVDPTSVVVLADTPVVDRAPEETIVLSAELAKDN